MARIRRAQLARQSAGRRAMFWLPWLTAVAISLQAPGRSWNGRLPTVSASINSEKPGCGAAARWAEPAAQAGGGPGLLL